MLHSHCNFGVSSFYNISWRMINPDLRSPLKESPRKTQGTARLFLVPQLRGPRSPRSMVPCCISHYVTTEELTSLVRNNQSTWMPWTRPKFSNQMINAFSIYHHKTEQGLSFSGDKFIGSCKDFSFSKLKGLPDPRAHEGTKAEQSYRAPGPWGH